MQELHVSDYDIMDFMFGDQSTVAEHLHQNPEVFYLIEGEGNLIIEDECFPMKKDDFVILNANVRHAFHGDLGAFYACIQINYTMAARCVDLQNHIFVCNSAKESNEGIAVCRRLIKQILSLYYTKNSGGSLHLTALYYELLDRFSAYFLVDKKDSRFPNNYSADSERISEICGYIYANYKYPIGLEDLAQQIFLSTAYLSKYIKKTLGMNFKEYLTSVRLQHAVDSMSRGQGQNLTRVALENGFPNVTAFIKAFKDEYQITPSAWLEARASSTPSEPLKDAAEQKIRQYIDNASIVDRAKEIGIAQLTASSEQGSPLMKYWNRMINLGLTSHLLRYDVQQQVLTLTKELNFTYVRIWDIYAPELQLNLAPGVATDYNFARLDRVFDFLVDNGIRPYIELGFKDIKLLNSINEYIIKEERPRPFASAEDFARFLRAFLRHYVQRYGLVEVQYWYFELWYDCWHTDSSGPAEYFRYFAAAHNTLKSIVPGVQVGGAGFEELESTDDFRSKLESWKATGCEPDFVSVYDYPYSHRGVERIMDPSHSRDYLSARREVVLESGLQTQEFHVSEWSSSVANRNAMSDSCNHGAFIVKSLIECIGCADMMGYWLGSDLYAEHEDVNQPLFGGVGLLTVDGIRKPSFYAYYFMNHLGRTLLARDEHSIVTTNGRDDFEIVCHNYKVPNQKYFSNAEDHFRYEEFERLFYDTSPEKLSFRLTDVRAGRYQIKTRLLNRENGSVQDEWHKIDQLQALRRQDVAYLKDICVPHNFVETQDVTRGELRLDAYLKPFEIRYIHITRQE